jgi:hypothetical protein
MEAKVIPGDRLAVKFYSIAITIISLYILLAMGRLDVAMGVGNIARLRSWLVVYNFNVARLRSYVAMLRSFVVLGSAVPSTVDDFRLVVGHFSPEISHLD